MEKNSLFFLLIITNPFENHIPINLYLCQQALLPKNKSIPRSRLKIPL